MAVQISHEGEPISAIYPFIRSAPKYLVTNAPGEVEAVKGAWPGVEVVSVDEWGGGDAILWIGHAPDTLNWLAGSLLDITAVAVQMMYEEKETNAKIHDCLSYQGYVSILDWDHKEGKHRKLYVIPSQVVPQNKPVPRPAPNLSGSRKYATSESRLELIERWLEVRRKRR